MPNQPEKVHTYQPIEPRVVFLLQASQTEVVQNKLDLPIMANRSKSPTRYNLPNNMYFTHENVQSQSFRQPFTDGCTH